MVWPAIIAALGSLAGSASDAANSKGQAFSPREAPWGSSGDPVSNAYRVQADNALMRKLGQPPLMRSTGPQSGMGASGGVAYQDAIQRVDARPEDVAAVVNATQDTTKQGTATTGGGGKFADILAKVAQGAQVGAGMANSQGAPGVPPNFGSGARWDRSQPISGGFVAQPRKATLGDLLNRFRR